jgi:hypothetical protein
MPGMRGLPTGQNQLEFGVSTYDWRKGRSGRSQAIWYLSSGCDLPGDLRLAETF